MRKKNNEINEEKQELNQEINEIKRKLYEKEKQLQNNNKLIDNLKNERNSINGELRHAVNIIQILKNKKTSQEFEEEPDDDTEKSPRI